MAYDPTFLPELITYMGGLLLLIGIVSILWLRFSFGIIAYLIKGAHRLGLYTPTPTNQRTASDKAIPRDRSFITFSRSLRAVSKLVPGEARNNPRTVIIPLLVIGLPLTVFFLLTMWVIPLLIFGWVIGTTAGTYSILIGILSIFIYMAALIGAWRLAKTYSPSIRTIRGVLSRR